MLIREATADDWPAIWAFPRDAVGLWRSLGFEVLATLPEGFRHPTAGYVGLHIMYHRL